MMKREGPDPLTAAASSRQQAMPGPQDELIKPLSGHSGSEVLLMRNDARGYFVRKIGDVARNVERYDALRHLVDVPKVYRHDADADLLDMQYIHGLDMVSYLLYEDLEPLLGFLTETLRRLQQSGKVANYRSVYEKKLQNIDFSAFGFPREALMERLPMQLVQSHYHGDFTLENIIFSKTDGKFYLIDPLTSDYDSVAFDLGKLQQDLRCGWFIRNKNVLLKSKLTRLYQGLADSFDLHRNDGQDNDHLLIAMLLRVYPYCKTSSDRDFIIRNVRKLWK